MTTTQRWSITCGGCGKHGPDADTSPEAKELAHAEGWSLGGKKDGYISDDYCQNCRRLYDRVQCNHRNPEKGQCVSDSRYRLSRANGLFTAEEVNAVLASVGIDPVPAIEKLQARVKDSGTWWVCGKHLPLFARDMLQATAEPVVVVRVL